jgi:hypothetical protein
MSFALEVQSEAIIDIQNAFEWYEMRRKVWVLSSLKKLKMVLENL